MITKSLALIGRHAVINAQGQQPVSKKLPGSSGVVVYQARNVEVSGFTVVHAGFDAILVVGWWPCHLPDVWRPPE